MILLEAYHLGKLGQTKMPESFSPNFSKKENELRLAYFTLPMSLNYQRDSYKLWQSALETYNDPQTAVVFNVKLSAASSEEKLRSYLMKHKIALQPNKHINTWQRICKTITENWGSAEGLLEFTDFDFLKLREVIQIKFKKGFPYLSGPKIFNYWSYIIQEYGGVSLKNSEFIEIAPDTHITKCSVILEVISKEESEYLSKDEVSKRWRKLLLGTKINPIDMHSPLWFWSKNNFRFKFK